MCLSKLLLLCFFFVKIIAILTNYHEKSTNHLLLYKVIVILTVFQVLIILKLGTELKEFGTLGRNEERVGVNVALRMLIIFSLLGYVLGEGGKLDLCLPQ